MGLFSKSKSKSPQPSFQSGTPPYTANTSANNSNYAPPSPPRQPVNSDARALPNGWISQYDPNSHKFFYVYTPTALRQWEHPADKPLGNANRGENASYNNQSQQQQQPYYPQQQQQQQRFYPQQGQFQPQYVQQPQYGRSSGGGMGYGKMAAAGVGGGLLGYMIGDAMFDGHPDTMVENNYYGDQGGGFDQGGFDNGGFDGGFDDGGFDM